VGLGAGLYGKSVLYLNVVLVKSKVKISQNFVAFSDMNFITTASSNIIFFSILSLFLKIREFRANGDHPKQCMNVMSLIKKMKPWKFQIRVNYYRALTIKQLENVVQGHSKVKSRILLKHKKGNNLLVLRLLLRNLNGMDQDRWSWPSAGNE
jgi:hypothetical protein